MDLGPLKEIVFIAVVALAVAGLAWAAMSLYWAVFVRTIKYFGAGTDFYSWYKAKKLREHRRKSKKI